MKQDSKFNQVLCMQNNNALTYVNLDASNGFSMPTFDPASHDCTLPKLSQISLSFDTE